MPLADLLVAGKHGQAFGQFTSSCQTRVDAGPWQILNTVILDNVCPSVMLFCLFWEERLGGLQNYFAQMFIVMRQCALRMCDPGQFKVTVTVWGHTCNSWMAVRVVMKLGTNIYHGDTVRRVHVWPRSVEGHGHSSWYNMYFWMTRSITKLLQTNFHHGETMCRAHV